MTHPICELIYKIFSFAIWSGAFKLSIFGHFVSVKCLLKLPPLHSPPISAVPRPLLEQTEAVCK